MAERVDAVAVDVRDRAGGAEREVAADEADADGVARRKRPALAGSPIALATRRRASHRLEAARRERAGDRSTPCRPRSRRSPAAWRSAAAARRARRPTRLDGRAPLKLHVVAGSARRPRSASNTCWSVAASDARRDGQLEPRAAPWTGVERAGRGRVHHLVDRRDAGDRLFENWPSEYETAPISRPSM